MIASKTGVLTNLGRLPSTTSNLVNTIACHLESDYCKIEYASDCMVNNI